MGFICILRCGGFALLILSHFCKYPMKMNNLVSLRFSNYFIFIGYLKIGGGEVGLKQTPSVSAIEKKKMSKIFLKRNRILPMSI